MVRASLMKFQKGLPFKQAAIVLSAFTVMALFHVCITSCIIFIVYIGAWYGMESGRKIACKKITKSYD